MIGVKVSVRRYGADVETDAGEVVRVERVGAWVSVDDADDVAEALAREIERTARNLRVGVIKL